MSSITRKLPGGTDHLRKVWPCKDSDGEIKYFIVYKGGIEEQISEDKYNEYFKALLGGKKG